MTTPRDPTCAGHRYPDEIISCAVMLLTICFLVPDRALKYLIGWLLLRTRRTRDIDRRAGPRQPCGRIVGFNSRRQKYPLLRSAFRGSADSVKTSDAPRLRGRCPDPSAALTRCRLGPASVPGTQSPRYEDGARI